VQQDVLLDNRSSSGAPGTSQEHGDCNANSALPATGDEVNSKLFHVNCIISKSHKASLLLLLFGWCWRTSLSLRSGISRTALCRKFSEGHDSAHEKTLLF